MDILVKNWQTLEINNNLALGQNASSKEMFQPDISDFTSLNPTQQTLFFEKIVENLDTDPEYWNLAKFDQISAVYQMDQVQNVRILALYLQFGLKVGSDLAYQRAERLVSSQSGFTYNRPLFRLMFEINPKRCLGLFEKLRPRLHPLVVDLLKKDFGMTEN